MLLHEWELSLDVLRYLLLPFIQRVLLSLILLTLIFLCPETVTNHHKNKSDIDLLSWAPTNYRTEKTMSLCLTATSTHSRTFRNLVYNLDLRIRPEYYC